MRVRIAIVIPLAAELGPLPIQLFSAPSSASAADAVHFPSAATDHASLNGELTRPPGAGPFPALVLMPACDGHLSNITNCYVGYFQQQGYVVLAVDENASRHVGNVCGDAASALPALETAKARSVPTRTCGRSPTSIRTASGSSAGRGVGVPPFS